MSPSGEYNIEGINVMSSRRHNNFAPVDLTFFTHIRRFGKVYPPAKELACMRPLSARVRRN